MTGLASSLLRRAQKIATSFDISSTLVNKAAIHLASHLTTALANPDSSTQLPSFITHLPSPELSGTYLAVDLGGTNLRISSVHLDGAGKYTIRHTQHPVPRNLMVSETPQPLFSFIASSISAFIADEKLLPEPGKSKLPLGFIFSFTVTQHSLTSGTLLAWDKGWSIPTAIGQDPCSLLQQAIDIAHLPVTVSALANDSIGTLMARAYSGAHHPLIGAIFGTGTNAAYVERRSAVTKVTDTLGTGNVMLMNSEWGGAFDEVPEVLVVTEWDQRLDARSTNPGLQIMEKRVGGLYLGELLRLVILSLVSEGFLAWKIAEKDGPLVMQNAIDSEILSVLAKPHGPATTAFVQETLGEEVTNNEIEALSVVSRAIARRAARIAGACIAGIILRTDPAPVSALASVNSTSSFADVTSKFFITVPRQCTCSILTPLAHNIKVLLSLLRLESKVKASTTQAADKRYPRVRKVDVGVDGSLVEFYPFFEEDMREALWEVEGIGEEGEEGVTMGLVREGSSIGAAIAALYSEKERERGQGV